MLPAQRKRWFGPSRSARGAVQEAVRRHRRTRDVEGFAAAATVKKPKSNLIETSSTRIFARDLLALMRQEKQRI